jgi:hypothetical protein
LSYAFEELLRPDAGFEIYMRDIADYGYASSSSTANTIDKLHSSSSSEVVGEATFLELAARAEARGHVAIGIDRARTGSSSSGSSTEREQILCPDKRRQYTLRRGDRLIVLATYTQK